jgi:hypothetical protein
MLGRGDSNLRMPGPKPGALPLGYAPNFFDLLIKRYKQTGSAITQ